MDTTKNDTKHALSKMEVLDIADLDAVEAGMSAMLLEMANLEYDAYAWSRISTER